MSSTSARCALRMWSRKHSASRIWTGRGSGANRRAGVVRKAVRLLGPGHDLAHPLQAGIAALDDFLDGAESDVSCDAVRELAEGCACRLRSRRPPAPDHRGLRNVTNFILRLPYWREAMQLSAAFLSILPYGVVGSSPIRVRAFGTLYLASLLRQNWSSSSALRPSVATRKACTASPQSGVGDAHDGRCVGPSDVGGEPARPRTSRRSSRP